MTGDRDDPRADLAPVRVDLGPGVTGLFTTRTGGTSPAPWDSLNLGLNVHDAPERVRANRDLVARSVGAPLCFVTQVHGDGVVLVDGSAAPGAPGPEVTADALVATRPGHALAITVADCVPVLLADAGARVVAAVHAGRAGVQAGVVPRAVAAMRAAGARDLRAVVGPCVCGRCYEVPQALRDEVSRQVPAAFSTTRTGTPALDLRAAVAAQLTDAGVADVRHVERCTLEDETFFSHRRATAAGAAPTGRFAAVVVLDAGPGPDRPEALSEDGALGRVVPGRVRPGG